MSNIKAIRFKPRLHALVDVLISTWSMAAMLHNVFIIFRCRRAHEPMIRSTAHANYEKRVAWFSIYACCSLPIVFVFHLAALWAARAAL